MVAGMQEFTAAEALYDLSTRGKYDLVVLDTPPARNALDFLEARAAVARNRRAGMTCTCQGVEP